MCVCGAGQDVDGEVISGKGNRESRGERIWWLCVCWARIWMKGAFPGKEKENAKEKESGALRDRGRLIFLA